MPDHAFIAQIEQGDLAALQQHDPMVLRQWRSQKRHNTVLHHAARHGQAVEQILPFLLALGMDVNARNSAGQTPVMCIFERPGHETMGWLHALAHQGAHLDVHDRAGHSFVSECVAHHRWEALEWALGHGAKRHSPGAPWTGCAEYPLYFGHARHYFKSKRMQEWFDRLDVVCPPTQDDIDRAFLLALRKGVIECARHYHALGAKLVARDDEGNTAAHLVARLARDRNGSALPGEYLEWVKQVAAAGIGMQDRNQAGQSLTQLFDQAAHPDYSLALRKAMAEGQAEALHKQVAHPVARNSRPRF